MKPILWRSVGAVMAVVLITACSGSGQPQTSPESSTSVTGKSAPGVLVASSSAFGEAPALATMTTANGLRYDVIGIERTTADAVTVHFRISNDSPNAVSPVLFDISHGPYPGYNRSFSGMYLLDLQGQRVSYVMVAADAKGNGDCLCSEGNGWDAPDNFPHAGFSTLAYGVYAMPATATSVLVGSNQLDGLSTAVPIRPASSDPARFQGEPDIRTIQDGQKKIFPVVTRAGARQTTATDTQVQIALMSDILFEFNRADLASATSDNLEQIATQLKAQAQGTVRLVGSTDDSGETAYNLDLSKRRAETVHDALAPLVAGSGLTFDVQGKGEADPAVPNISDENRKQNRRVTVTFDRKPQASASAPTPAPTTPGTTGQNGAVVASVTGKGDLQGLTMAVTSLRRLDSQSMVGVFKAENHSDHAIDLNQYSTAIHSEDADLSPTHYHGGSLFWIYAFQDPTDRYYVVSDDQEYCLCSETPRLGPGESQSLYAVLTAPPGISHSNVSFFGFSGTAQNIPITD